MRWPRVDETANELKESYLSCQDFLKKDDFKKKWQLDLTFKYIMDFQSVEI